MTFDEIFMFHEKFTAPFQKFIGGKELGIFYFAWVIPFGVIVIILSFIFFKFWYRLPLKTRLTFIIAAIIYVGGAIGVEFIESWITDIYGEDNLLYEFIATIQESLEMYGVIVFIWSLLDYLTEQYRELHFSFFDDTIIDSTVQ